MRKLVTLFCVFLIVGCGLFGSEEEDPFYVGDWKSTENPVYMSLNEDVLRYWQITDEVCRSRVYTVKGYDRQSSVLDLERANVHLENREDGIYIANVRSPKEGELFVRIDQNPSTLGACATTSPKLFQNPPLDR